MVFFTSPVVHEANQFPAVLQSKLAKLQDLVEAHNAEAACRQKSHYDKTSSECHFVAGDIVWLSMYGIVPPALTLVPIFLVSSRPLTCHRQPSSLLFHNESIQINATNLLYTPLCYTQGSYRILKNDFKDFSRTFKYQL